MADDAGTLSRILWSLSHAFLNISLSRRISMNRIIMIAVLVILGSALATAQTWTPVWKMTQSPYLTLQDITEMGTVKAGFDTDQDGWGELICSWTDLDTNAIMIYEANGDNSYQLVWSWNFLVDGTLYNASIANTYAQFAVGDVNNNGVVDIVVTLPTVVGPGPLPPVPNPPRVWFFEWNGVVGENHYGFYNSTTKTYDPSGSWNFNAPDNYDLRPYSLEITDIDNDGANELITGIRAAGAGSDRGVIVSSVTGDFGSFVFYDVEWQYFNTFGGSCYSVTTGDLDKDGNKEIYMFVWDLFTMRIFEWNPVKVQMDTVFAVDNLYSVQGIDYGALDAVCVADANKDGVNELYIAGTEPENTVFVVGGMSDISTMTSADIKELYHIPVTSLGKFRSMQVADPDGDGNIDLMIAGESNGQIFSLEYKGSGDPTDGANWEHHILFDIFNESGLTSITPRLFYGYPAHDMDKDGKDEYAFVNYSPDFSTWAGDSPLWIIESPLVNDVRDEAAGIPADFKLLQNYPNPFNPSTTIPYQLAARSHVRLDVYNVYGQLVTSVVNAEREAGYYQANWTANVPSGTYFYRLSVEPVDGKGSAFQDVKKMVLVR
jgi:hypothetical protein